MTRDAAATKRDCDADTRAMEDFAKRIMDTSWTERIREDLESMNFGKVGHPFVFPDSLIDWAIMAMASLNISYRLARGFVNKFLGDCGYRGMSLSQFYQRCVDRGASDKVGCITDSRILACGSMKVKPSGKPLAVAVDSTGLSLNKYGGWLAHKWGLKQVSGWVKLHVAVDTDTNEVLAYVITDESCGDVTCLDLLMDHVQAAGHKVGRLLADGAYDSKAVWKKYSDMGIEVVINIRSGQLGKYDGDRYRGKSNGCIERGNQIKRIKKVGKNQWELEMGYGQRWKVECTFSDLKRLFGDILRARTRRCAVLETIRKVMALNIYKDCRRQATGV